MELLELEIQEVEEEERSAVALEEAEVRESSF